MASHIENLVLPISLKRVHQVLDFEAHSGLDLSVMTLFKHGLKTAIKVVQCHDGVFGPVLLLLSFTFGLILFALRLVIRLRGWVVLRIFGGVGGSVRSGLGVVSLIL